MAEDDDPGRGATPVPEVTRAEQARILRALAARLDEGEPTLPTDVLGQLSRELDRRRDEVAIAESWSEQDGREGEPWVFCRARALG